MDHPGEDTQTERDTVETGTVAVCGDPEPAAVCEDAWRVDLRGGVSVLGARRLLGIRCGNKIRPLSNFPWFRHSPVTDETPGHRGVKQSIGTKTQRRRRWDFRVGSSGSSCEPYTSPPLHLLPTGCLVILGLDLRFQDLCLTPQWPHPRGSVRRKL